MLVVAIIAIAPASLNLNRALSLSTLTAFRTPWFTTTTTLRVRSSVDGGGGGLWWTGGGKDSRSRQNSNIQKPFGSKRYGNHLDLKDTKTCCIQFSNIIHRKYIYENLSDLKGISSRQIEGSISILNFFPHGNGSMQHATCYLTTNHDVRHQASPPVSTPDPIRDASYIKKGKEEQ